MKELAKISIIKEIVELQDSRSNKFLGGPVCGVLHKEKSSTECPAKKYYEDHTNARLRALRQFLKLCHP